MAAQKKTKIKKTVKPQIKNKKEPAVVRVENAKGKAQMVIICDHASNALPKKYGTLGLAKKDLQKHIAWDPGTENIGRYIAKKLDSTVVLAGYSRLLVDLNRGPDNGECMRDVSDHIAIPGNKKLSRTEQAARLKKYYWPYHDTIGKQIDRFTKKGIYPVLLSVHSFTPEMDGKKRPWHIGVLWNREQKIAKALCKNLRAKNKGLVVGENAPYSLKTHDTGVNSISRHAEGRGLPYVIVEFRQDLVGTKKGAEKYAEMFLQALRPVLEDPATYKKREILKKNAGGKKRK